MAYRLRAFEELNAAVEQGDLETVKSLVEQPGIVNINSVPWGMESVLMRALRCQHKEVAKYLIEKGVDIGYHYTSKEFDDDIPVAEKFKSTAREYAEFYKLPEIVTLIDQKTGRIQNAEPMMIKIMQSIPNPTRMLSNGNPMNMKNKRYRERTPSRPDVQCCPT